jgi:hypothetical protein
MDVSKLILRDPFMKSYAARLKTYEGWSLTFMDKDEMAAADSISPAMEICFDALSVKCWSGTGSLGITPSTDINT